MALNLKADITAERLKLYRDHHECSLEAAKWALQEIHLRSEVEKLRLMPHRMAKRGELADLLEFVLDLKANKI